MVHRPLVCRLLVPAACSVLAAATFAAPAAEADTSATTTTTTALIPLPTTTTTVAPAPATTTPTTTPKSTTTTTAAASSKTSGTGVPSVPVAGPPTTTLPPGAKPAPQPDPAPILAQVDGDLAQLTAIADYKPAQGLVTKAQDSVTKAGATLLSGRQSLDQAQAVQAQDSTAKSTADSKLRELAIAAYIGVGFTSPGFNQPAQGNGNQGSGTVSTPQGLTGMDAIDAQEMLMVVGQHARQDDEDAVHTLDTAVKATKVAQAAYQKDQAAVTGAEAQLLAAQQTLKVVIAAAITPGAAAATPLPNLTSTNLPANPAAPPPTTTTTVPASRPAAAVPTINGAAPTSPTIMGTPVLDQAQLQAWWATLNRKANLTVPVNTLIASYATWGKKLAIRDDLAFAQSIVETGYFSFPAGGQLTAKDNNFAGIGACDSCAHGWSFPTADVGVQAQLELLHEYASDQPWPAQYNNVIGGTGIGGCCATWTKLAGHWASSTVYGISIMTVYQQMLSWLIPQEELTDGLIVPSTPAAKGPELAPLSGGAKKPAGPTTTTTTAPKGVSAASLHKQS